MSKKKNTLKDLDEFLKQQAATLVTPIPLSEKATPESTSEHESSKARTDSDSVIDKVAEPAPPPKHQPPISAQRIINDIHTLAENNGMRFKPQLYDILLQAFKKQESFSPEDKMLINTLLYLKHGESWKSAIQNFWKSEGR